MAENTKIEWTDHTFNPWEGCQKVAPPCDNCYAELRNARFAGGQAINWGPGAPRRRTSVANWNKPKAWNANAAAFLAEHGRRQRVFCASLSDWADNAVSIEWLVDLLELVHTTPNLDWLMLTKRIGIVLQRLQEAHNWVLANWPAVDAQPLSQWLQGWTEDKNPPANVWLGATVASQAEADRDIPKLLAVPARVRFLSMEPLLGPVDLRLQRPAREDDRQDMDGYCSHITTAAGAGIHWVIVGGESGPGARPMHPDWARSLRDQCAAAGVPFLFKQWGEHDLSYDRDRDDPDYCRCVSVEKQPGRWLNLAGGHGFNGERVHYAHRVGKKAAGRVLDGRTHDGFPAQSAAAHKGK